MLVLVMSLVAVRVWDAPLFAALAAGFAASWVSAAAAGQGHRAIAGFAWQGLRRMVPVFWLLCLVGAMISTWLAGGTVPGLIYYGLMLARPGTLLITAFVLASATSMMLGSSIGTLSTVGLALMGVAKATGVAPPVMAGALVSGALLGDRTSPLSAAFQLIVNMTEVPRGEALRTLAATGAPAWVLSCGCYYLVGLAWEPAVGAAAQAPAALMTGLASAYHLQWPVLLPPLVVLALALSRLPVLYGLGAGVLAGAAVAVGLQGNTAGAVLSSVLLGFRLQSGDPVLDSVVAGGGLLPMVPMLLLLAFAGAFSGVMEGAGLLEGLVRPLLARLKGARALLVGTMGLSCLTGAVMANQVLAIIIPARILRGEFKRRAVPAAWLARALADSGTTVSPLMPWNLMAVISAAALGVPTVAYAPYAALLYLLPLVTLVWVLADPVLYHDYVDHPRDGVAHHR